MCERDDERRGRGEKEQDEEAAKRSTERRLTRCVWAALSASIRRHLKCVHVHTRVRARTNECTHARTYAYDGMNGNRPLCSTFAKMAGFRSEAAAQEIDKKYPIGLAKCLRLSRRPRQLMAIGRKSFYVFILARSGILCLSRDRHCRYECRRRDLLSYPSVGYG